MSTLTHISQQRAAANASAGQWPMPEVHAVGPADLHREALEQYIATVFHTAYGARIFEFLPLLFALRQGGQTTAALGLRCATHPLFCEQYIDLPVEQLVEKRFGVIEPRINMMELGNLVGSQPGTSAMLYLLVTASMHRAGISHLIFAANDKVRASIMRSGFTPLAIAPALPQKLGHKAAAWGSYYATNPQVMLADIALTYSQAIQQPTMGDLLSHYQTAIAVLADAIDSQRRL